MRNPRNHKGITPVIAIILLLMMTVAVAGGAYVWFTQLGEGFQQQAEESQDRGVDFVDLQCSNNAGNARVTAFLKNTGQKQLDLNPVDMIVRNRATSEVDFSLTRTDLNLQSGSLSTGITAQGGSDITSPGDSEQYHIDNQNSNTFTSGDSYVIEFQFTDEEDLTVSDICRAD